MIQRGCAVPSTLLVLIGVVGVVLLIQIIAVAISVTAFHLTFNDRSA